MSWPLYLVKPDWRGRRRIERWSDDRSIVLIQQKRDFGHENRWYLAQQFNDSDPILLPVFSQDVLTSSPGSNVSYTKPGTWNDADNWVDCIGGGGSGGVANRGSNLASGGGGGAWSRRVNFTFTGGSATRQVGIAGPGTTSTVGALETLSGSDGGNTWFDGTTFAGATVGAEGGKAGAAATSGAGVSGGSGGLASSRPNTGSTSGNDGGRGGNVSVGPARSATGGGGAGGLNGAGNQGVDTSASDANTNGGSGDAGSGGSAGTGNDPGTAGGAGSEYTTAGSGGGGGADHAAANSTLTGQGAGGAYGGGSGGAHNEGSGSNKSTQTISANGSQGLIVVNWTPSTFTWFSMHDLGLPPKPRIGIIGY